MISKCKLIRIFLLLTIFFLLLLGFALLRISFLPFESVKPNIDTAFASCGSTGLFTESVFKQIIIKLQLLAAVFFIAALFLYINRQQAQQYVSNILTSCLSFSRELKQQLNEVLKKEDKIHLCTLFIILLLAIAVRLFFLFQPVRHDEAFTFLCFASKPLYSGLSYYPRPNNHLFHTFLVHVAYILFGNKTWVIRLPAFFAGILLVPASYLLIRSFYNKHAALLTAGSVASSSLLIEYSTNARGYTLICLFFLLILTLAKYLKENRNSFAWLLFAALSTIGFYTIPVMLYPFGVVVVWFLLSITFKDTNLNPSLLLKDLFSALIMIALFTFMLYLPVLIISGLESVIGNKFVTPQPWSSLVTQFTALLHLVWKKWNRDIPIGIDIVFISGFFISLAFHKRLTTQCIPIILAVPIWCIPILTVQRIVPPERVWLFLLPLYIGAASSGVSYILKRVESKIGLTSSRCTYSKPGESIGNSISIILSLALSLLLSFNVIHNKSIYYSDEGGPLRDAEEITIFLKNYLMPGDRVMVTGVSDSLLEYYFNLHGLPVRHLYLNLDFSHRILAVVNKSENQTIEKVLNEAGLSTTGFSIPRVIKQYPSAALYEIKRYDIYPHHKT